MNVFDNNTYHFYEVSNALATYIFRTDEEQLETEELCFDLLSKKAAKKFPGVANTSQYNSAHMFALQRIQSKFRDMLELRKKRQNSQVAPKPYEETEVENIAHQVSPQQTLH